RPALARGGKPLDGTGGRSGGSAGDGLALRGVEVKALDGWCGDRRKVGLAGQELGQQGAGRGASGPGAGRVAEACRVRLGQLVGVEQSLLAGQGEQFALLGGREAAVKGVPGWLG